MGQVLVMPGERSHRAQLSQHVVACQRATRSFSLSWKELSEGGKGQRRQRSSKRTLCGVSVNMRRLTLGQKEVHHEIFL